MTWTAEWRAGGLRFRAWTDNDGHTISFQEYAEPRGWFDVGVLHGEIRLVETEALNQCILFYLKTTLQQFVDADRARRAAQTSSPTVQPKIEVTVMVDEVEYTAIVDLSADGDQVEILRRVGSGRMQAGRGTWEGHSIGCCTADLGDAVFDALDEAINDQIEDA